MQGFLKEILIFMQCNKANSPENVNIYTIFNEYVNGTNMKAGTWRQNMRLTNPAFYSIVNG